MLNKIKIVWKTVVSWVNRIVFLPVEVDSLYYFLNNIVDIRKIGPTKDVELREMQLGLLNLLRIFDKICKKHGLVYWLDYGTLLGAIRHGGFIPWDDDLDVSMPRSDYNRLVSLVKNDLEKFGLFIRHGGYFDDYGYMLRLAIGYKTLETGMWLDVFPVDPLYTDKRLSDAQEMYSTILPKYQKYYEKNENKQPISVLEEQKNKFFSPFSAENKNSKHKYYCRVPELAWGPDSKTIFEEKDIFPLHNTLFEGYEFPVPNASERLLAASYGENYMSFPHFGIENHCNPDGLLAKKRAKANGVCMQGVIDYLYEVLERI